MHESIGSIQQGPASIAIAARANGSKRKAYLPSKAGHNWAVPEVPPQDRNERHISEAADGDFIRSR
eukprot:4474753-Pleurochrysis_carterae.AAC.1